MIEIEGVLNEERRIDETVTRSSAILHFYTSLIVTNNVWLEEALFYLLKNVSEKIISN